MAFTGTSDSYLTKAQILAFVRKYLYDESEAVSTLRARRANYRERAERLRMVLVMYKLWFVNTAATGSGDNYDQQTAEDQFMIRSWFAGEIGLQIRDQVYSGTVT